jgi:ribonuclease BN (tRNA processing enzyme)
LLSEGDTHVWVDCGPGTLANVQQHVALEDITAVVISHEHPDHWVELPVLHNALHYFLGRRDVPLYTTRGTMERFEAIKTGSVTETFRPHVIADGSHFEVDGLAFRTSRTDHPVETMALRIEAGDRSLLYSADTASGWTLGQLGAADVALCEASLRTDQAGLAPHLTTTQAGASARAAGVGRLIITHLPPGADAAAHQAEAADAFGAEVEVATTNARFTI